MAYYYFPGKSLYLRPGYLIAAQASESAATKDSRWSAFLTTTPDRSTSYRPDGVYVGISLREKWKNFYVNESVRPTNPSDYTDSAYDWSPLNNAFTTTAFVSDNALVELGIMDKNYGVSGVSNAPAWLVNAPYNGTYYSSSNGSTLICYHRYTGPDLRGQSNVNSSLGPPIVDEFIAFHQALHDYISAQGWADRVWHISSSEYYGSGDSGYITDFYHGAGVYLQQVAAIWAASHVPVQVSSINGQGSGTAILESYITAADLDIGYPDGKLTDTSAPPTGRFEVAGTYQSPYRELMQSFETNGLRADTYFAPGVSNPWGYSDTTVTQTASHLLWAFSGSPKGTVKDSGLGQSGDDPPGLIPAHILKLVWWSGDPLNIPLADWHTAIDTFGPPGTFAHPPFPAGYPPPPGPGYGADGPYGSSRGALRGSSRSFGYFSRRAR